MASPDDIKREINNNYQVMKERVRLGQINESCIYRIVEAQARAGASLSGISEYWDEFMPDELWIKYHSLDGRG
jgi:hypothetical protein